MQSYMLLESYLWPALFLVCYTAALKLGPILMKNRTAYDLKGVLVVYNLSQIVFNLSLFIKFSILMSITGIFCTSKYESSTGLVDSFMDLLHNYFLLKLYDLLDTMFFILRKKEKQVTVLHVYHHINMFVIVWGLGKFFPVYPHFPAGSGIVFGWWNTMVHTIMYSYYLLSAIGHPVKSSWWKKYITLLQLVQHCSLFILGLIILMQEECPYPKIVISIFELLGGVLIYLFGVFYVRTYVKNRNTKDGKANEIN